MSLFAQLWAQGPGIEDLIKLAIIVLFVVVPVVLKLLGKFAGPQNPANGRRPAAPPPRPPAGGDVEQEVGEFLRRATQRQQVAAPPPVGRSVTAQVVRELPAEAQLVLERPVAAETVRERPPGRLRQPPAQRDVSTGQSVLKASRLGEEVVQADEQFDRRLEQVFDRQLSTLAPGQVAPPPQPVQFAQPELPTPASSSFALSVPALLTSAEGVRQAIIAVEILQRPEHRWK